jgi:hypothetical protein
MSEDVLDEFEVLADEARLARAEAARWKSEYDGLLRLYAAERDARALAQRAGVSRREALPQRRYSEVLEYSTHRGILYTITVGYYDDGRPAEVFLDSGKSGADTQVMARDAAILMSLLLQYGCPVSHIRQAISREEDGSPQGPIGAILDILEAA